MDFLQVNRPIFLSLPTLPFTINRLLPLQNSNNIFPYLFLIISILLRSRDNDSNTFSIVIGII